MERPKQAGKLGPQELHYLAKIHVKSCTWDSTIPCSTSMEAALLGGPWGSWRAVSYMSVSICNAFE